LFAAATLNHFGGVPFEMAIACRQKMRATAEQLSYANSSIMYEYVDMFNGWMRDGLQQIMKRSDEDLDHFIQEVRQYLAEHASIMKDPIESRKISTRREIVEYMIRNGLPKARALAALQDPHLLSPPFTESSKDKLTKSVPSSGPARSAKPVPYNPGSNPNLRSPRRFPVMHPPTSTGSNSLRPSPPPGATTDSQSVITSPTPRAPPSATGAPPPRAGPPRPTRPCTYCQHNTALSEAEKLHWSRSCPNRPGNSVIEIDDGVIARYADLDAGSLWGIPDVNAFEPVSHLSPLHLECKDAPVIAMSSVSRATDTSAVDQQLLAALPHPLCTVTRSLYRVLNEFYGPFVSSNARSLSAPITWQTGSRTWLLPRTPSELHSLRSVLETKPHIQVLVMTPVSVFRAMGLTDWLRDRPIAIRSATALILEHDSTPLSLGQHDWFVALLSSEVEINRLVQSRFEALSPAGNSPIEYHDLIRHTDHILCYRYLGAPSNAALEDLYTQQSREAKARAEAQAIMAA
jgi:hypothetical protein